jgi:hypothetical protein
MEQHGTKQWTKLLPLIAYNLNTSKPSSTKIMPYRVVFNKLPNLGNKKNFIEIDKDGKEAPIEEEEPTTSSAANNEVVEEREEEVEELREGEEGEEEEEEIDENLLELREQLNKNMDKNAAMMIKKHDHKRNKTTREFILNDNVSVSIPRIDRGGTDLRRLPGKVIKISEGLNKFYTVLTVWGILKDIYRSTRLEPFSGIVEVNLEDSREISLNEAAKLQNASTGSLETVNVICNCGTKCKDDGRCKCAKANKLCTSHCHTKMKGKPVCCLNHDKGKKAKKL